MPSTNPDPFPPRLYRTQFEEVEKLFDEGRLELCITAAKYNLSDSTLPPYYVIRYCILLASAHDSWDQGDKWRLLAEQTYDATLSEARGRNDVNSLEILPILRKELDSLHDIWMEDMTGLTREERDEFANRVSDEEEEEDEDQILAALEEEELASMDFEEQMEVAAVENADEIAAETITLPILEAAPAAQAPTPTLVVPPIEGPTAAHPKLRRAKSARFNPGGAYNALQFSKALGSTGTSSCGCVPDAEGQPKTDKSD